MPSRRTPKQQGPAVSAARVIAAGAEAAEAITALLAYVMEPAWSHKSVTDYLAAPGSFAFLVLPESKGRKKAPLAPAGVLLARVGADSCDLAAMGVAPAQRGRGLGAALLEKAMQTAAAAGARHMFLEVAEGNRAAIALYQSRGFRVAGRRAGYYRGAGPADALLMRREIGQLPDSSSEKSPPRP